MNNCRREPILLSIKRDIFAEAEDLHAFGGIGTAGDDGFFLSVVFDPDLAVEAVAVPAEVGVGNLFDIEELETAENRVVFGDQVLAAEYFDFDKAFVGGEDFGMGLHLENSVSQKPAVVPPLYANRDAERCE
jgi:hypothetical protein